VATSWWTGEKQERRNREAMQGDERGTGPKTVDWVCNSKMPNNLHFNCINRDRVH